MTCLAFRTPLLLIEFWKALVSVVLLHYLWYLRGLLDSSGAQTWMEYYDCPACLQTHRGTATPLYVQVQTIFLIKEINLRIIVIRNVKKHNAHLFWLWSMTCRSLQRQSIFLGAVRHFNSWSLSPCKDVSHQKANMLYVIISWLNHWRLHE